jgi:hypothetical protein
MNIVRRNGKETEGVLQRIWRLQLSQLQQVVVVEEEAVYLQVRTRRQH